MTPPDVEALIPLALYSLVALVGQFLPSMIERGEGAILTAAGASAVQGMPPSRHPVPRWPPSATISNPYKPS